MNKLKYKEEQILKPWLFLLTFYLIIILLFHKELSGSSVPVVVLSVFFLIFALSLIKSTIETKKIIKKYNEIKINGQNYEGRILKALTETKSNFTNGEDRGYAESYVMVEYTDSQTQEVKTYITPALSFNPYHNLGSKVCSVYIYHNKIYVTDFVKRKFGQKNIWTKEELDTMH